MNQPDSQIRGISDTARWVAVYRARETERPDAVFRDPFARRLSGERGQQIAASIPFAEKHSWPFVARTWAVDQFVHERVAGGADLVVNLAAGLDARPYRMELPPSLHWVEVDLPEILAHKEEVLRNEKPVCRLERIRLNLSDVNARRELFAQLESRARNALIISEGLLVYLTTDEVTALARDLAVPKSFRHWMPISLPPRSCACWRSKWARRSTRPAFRYDSRRKKVRTSLRCAVGNWKRCIPSFTPPPSSTGSPFSFV